MLSDHGFQSHFKRFNLGNWLNSQGYLKIKPSAAVKGMPFLKKITQKLRVGKFLSSMLSQATIQSLDKKYLLPKEPIEWKGSLAYSTGKSTEGFLYLLSQSENLAVEIKQKLVEMKDPQTGRPFIKKVWFKNDLYHGDKTEFIPDIIIEMEDGYTCTGQYLPDQGLFHTVSPEADMHMGQHHREGIIVLSGSAIVQRRGISAGIMDIAPTVLHCLGCLVPDAMDGRILKEVLLEPMESDKKGEISNVFPQNTNKQGYSAEDEKNIEVRLKDLGYL
jgi:predicted AlkP superfamily phosphohydrolase/phosphomutase